MFECIHAKSSVVAGIIVVNIKLAGKVLYSQNREIIRNVYKLMGKEVDNKVH